MFPKRGAVSYTKGTCTACKKKFKKLYYETNKVEILKKQAEYQRNTLSVKLYQAEYFQKNKEKNYIATKKWRKLHPEKQKEILTADYQARKGCWPEYLAARRSRLLRAFPKWANRSAISEIYTQARTLRLTTGKQYHVDHIVPLNHSKVCGLHVEYNLQILEAKDNLTKGNRHWPDMT